MYCKCGLKMERKYVMYRQGGPFFPWDLVCPLYRWWRFWKHNWRPMEYWDVWE